MIDTRAVAQEVQDQLLAAVQRGQEQMRKSQDQMRKSREAVADVIRTGNRLAKTVRPSVPSLPKPAVRVPSLSTLPSPEQVRTTARELTDHVIATQRSLTGRALHAAGPVAEQVVARQRKLADELLARQREVADQVVARQRELAGKALEIASPLVTEGVAKLTHVVGTLQEARRPRRAAVTPLHAVPTDEVGTPAAEATADGTLAEPVIEEPTEHIVAAVPTAKPRVTRSTAKSGTAPKARTAKSRAATTAGETSTKAPATRKTASTSKTRAPKK